MPNQEPPAERFAREAREITDKYKKESDEKMARRQATVDKGDRLSMQNFSEWREYLHKYFLLILAIVGGTGIFNPTQSEDPFANRFLFWGMILAIVGLAVGLIAIHLYFYFERKWMQISINLELFEPYNLYNHPDAGDNIVLGMKLNLQEIIEKKENELTGLTSPKDIEKIRGNIKADKAMIKLLKYIGSQHGFMEKFWILGVVLSVGMSFIGITLILGAIMGLLT